MVEMIKKGLNLWRSRVNEACETDQKQLIGRDGVWKCFLSPVASLYNEGKIKKSSFFAVRFKNIIIESDYR